MNSNITSLKEQSIKHRTGSEILIGSYGEDSNTGQAYFSDIRGEDGAVVDRTLIERMFALATMAPNLRLIHSINFIGTWMLMVTLSLTVRWRR